MSNTVFILLLGIFASISALVVEGFKNAYKGIAGKKIKSKGSVIVALIVSLLVGSGGSVVWYIFKDISFDTIGIITIVLMTFATILVSQVGYDKVKEIVQKIGGGE